MKAGRLIEILQEVSPNTEVRCGGRRYPHINCDKLV